ncbi:MAG: S8 family serine peptidase [Deltaproteobacteria bacterium]|nr:S8 family serine peptidase [Deltaproteobacteria bacterium]
MRGSLLCLPLFALTVSATGVVASAEAATPSYYYSHGRRIDLQPATRFLAVEERLSLPAPDALRMLEGLPLSAPRGLVRRVGDRALSLVQLDALSPSVDLRSFIAARGAYFRAVPTFAVFDRDGAEASALIPTEDVLLRPNAGVNESEWRALVSSAGLTIADHLGEHIWLARAADHDAAMNGANALYESGRFKYATPSFLYEHKKHFAPNDKNYQYQWHFDNLQAEAAWNITKGSDSITIAIVDSGVDDKHPDLAAKLVKPYDAAQNKQGTAFPIDGEPHGTSCAGDAAAISNNTIGVAGVCHGCKVMPIRLLTASGWSAAGSDVRAFQWAWQNGADIISNSWGASQPVAVDDALADAVDEAATKGRGGKGSVVLFASGNDYRENYKEEMASLPSALSIGASDAQDRRFSYSDYGPYVTVLAPSASVTTDISGADGYSTTDYTGSFGGTSSACPVAAGVVGLMLSANPALTSQQIRWMVTQAVDKVQPTIAKYNASGFSYEYAFGRLNALKAVQMAQNGQACVAAAENCTNGKDDDCDGQSDADDIDCYPSCTSDQDCTGGKICDTSAKKCRPHQATGVKVGATCTSAETCGGSGDAICGTAAQGFPSGYCTTRCSDTCPGASACHGYGVLGNSYCFANCTTSTDCRSSYVCSAMGDAKATTGGCIPACKGDADCDKAGKKGAKCDTGTGYCAGDTTPAEETEPVTPDNGDADTGCDAGGDDDAEKPAKEAPKPPLVIAPSGDTGNVPNPPRGGCNATTPASLAWLVMLAFVLRRRRR